MQEPGRVLERGTVVMRNGLFTDVGSNIDIPYDADVIEGDSLVVYPGFIDGLSHAGIPETEEPERGRDVNPADPPHGLAGIQPDRSARTLLDPEDHSIEALRRLGFTLSHSVPRGRLLPGSGSILVLAGDEPSEMVLHPDMSLFFTFESGTGVYPHTPMGVMAALRQLVNEARRGQQIEELYAENPAGLERPTFDPVRQALYPVIRGERPIFALTNGTNSALEVHRAIQLGDELDIPIVLAGLTQGFEVIEHLDDIPLFLTLDLPKEPDEDEAADTTLTEAEEEADMPPPDTVRAMTPEDPASFFVSDLRTHSYEDVEDERRSLKARQALERDRYVATAAELHEAGLRFGMTTLGADPEDIRSNLREMIGAGLPEEGALSALTIDAARLLDLERVAGTIEPGKLANLVVTRGSYFDPDAPVRYVFIEGRKFEVDSDDVDDGENAEEAGSTTQ